MEEEEEGDDAMMLDTRIINDPEERRIIIRNMVMMGRLDFVMKSHSEGRITDSDVIPILVCRDLHKEYAEAKRTSIEIWEVELAVKYDSVKILRIISAKEPELITDNLSTFMYLALTHGSERCAELLREYDGLLYTDALRNDSTLFMKACLSGNEYCIKLAHEITRGKFVNEPYERSLPIHIALENGLSFLWDLVTDSLPKDVKQIKNVGKCIATLIWDPNWQTRTDYALMIRKIFREPRCKENINFLFAQKDLGLIKRDKLKYDSIPLLLAACNHANIPVFKEVLERSIRPPGDPALYMRDFRGRGIVWFICNSRSAVLMTMLARAKHLDKRGLNPAIIENDDNVIPILAGALFRACTKIRDGKNEILHGLLQLFRGPEMYSMTKKLLMKIETLKSGSGAAGGEFPHVSRIILQNFVTDYENQRI